MTEDVEKVTGLKEVVENNKKIFKLVIATPFYEVKGYSPYISSLCASIRALHELGVQWDYYELSGDSYVDRAKNTLVHRFMNDPEATHLMMIDSDMSWEIMGFLKIVKAALAGFEVVGAGYPCKNNWQFFGCIPKFSEDGSLLGKEIEDIRLLDMWCVPGGFVCYSRRAFERVMPTINFYKDLANNLTFYEFFRCNVEKNNTRVGEDVYFQLRYREAGGIVWMEPDVTIQHWGVKAWAGNYHCFLTENRQAAEVG